MEAFLGLVTLGKRDIIPDMLKTLSDFEAFENNEPSNNSVNYEPSIMRLVSIFDELMAKEAIEPLTNLIDKLEEKNQAIVLKAIERIKEG